MAKRKLSDETDLKFVHETKWSEETKTIGVEIKDFLVKIDDLENKEKPIKSPSFKLAGKELYVSIYPYVMLDMFYMGDLYSATQLKEASKFLISRNRDILKGLDLSRFPAAFIDDVLRILC